MATLNNAGTEIINANINFLIPFVASTKRRMRNKLNILNAQKINGLTKNVFTLNSNGTAINNYKHRDKLYSIFMKGYNQYQLNK